jgi:glycosyltransferase involved in cell wall biosynthesis
VKVLLFANTEWYLYNFRRSLALALRDAGHEVLLVSPPGPYGKKLESLGFRWIAAPMQRRSLNPLRELSLVLWLRRLIRDEHPDLVHGFTIKCAVYGLLAARLAGVIGRVGSIAGLGYVFISDDLRARALRPVVRALLRASLGGENARLIVQNSDDASLVASSRIVEPSQIRLIRGSGVDCERFSPAGDASGSVRTDERVRLLLASRLLWDKGLREYVAAARQLLADGQNAEFLLAGDPDEGNPASVSESDVRGWVEEGVLERLGHVDDMPDLYRSVDIVVLPSYREGLPKGLIEAAACGLPLVTTDVPGCREVVTDGVDGLLVPVRDSGALAEAIARLCDDPALRERLGKAARQKALAEFDERIVIKQTLDVYRELVS